MSLKCCTFEFVPDMERQKQSMFF